MSASSTLSALGVKLQLEKGKHLLFYLLYTKILFCLTGICLVDAFQNPPHVDYPSVDGA